jgi:hypothetical protein
MLRSKFACPIEHIVGILKTIIKYSTKPKNTIKRYLTEHLSIVETKEIIWKWEDYDSEVVYASQWSQYLFHTIVVTEGQQLKMNISTLLPIIQYLSANLTYESLKEDFYKFTLIQLVENIKSRNTQFLHFISLKFDITGNYNFKAFLKDLIRINFDNLYSLFDNILYVLSEESEFIGSVRKYKLIFKLLEVDFFNNQEEIKKLTEECKEEVIERITPSAMIQLGLRLNYFASLKFITVDTKDKINKLIDIETKLTYGYVVKIFSNVKSGIEAWDYFNDEDDFGISKELNSENELDSFKYAEMVYFQNVPVVNRISKANSYKQFVTDLLGNQYFKELFERILLSKTMVEFFKSEQQFEPHESKSSNYFAYNNLSILWQSIKFITLPNNITGMTSDMLRIFINTVPKRIHNCCDRTDDQVEQEVKLF